MFRVSIINHYGQEECLDYKENQYRNLMELIVDRLGEDIGDCKGRAWCGTCHVELIEGELKSEMDSDEKTTLSGLYNYKESSRLACQLIPDQQLNGLKFKLLSEDDYE
ncbi:MAG: ferredoxin [Bacteroidetes bacterium]|nr:MAG: ferredoxin [Bacteroidota bacterium]MBL1145141.1 ferredoxin [Bacteroidota bacterium]MCB0802645.1 2Fe-2S iron-sulfur cluster binding domain-containing protein [Flavobacteriales bacterium]NOG57937.1 2Fe-2S iron-sulfur cluster binding domain-containing protein [Bacteroidota bacterium]